MDLKEAETIGGDPSGHWYYIAKGRAIKAMLGDAPVREVLDVGAGSGVFSKMLLRDRLAGRAVCVDPNYDDAWLADADGDRMSFVRSVDKVAAELVMMVDVIEHVDDDVALIRDYAERAAAGTRFFFSVPAFQFMWSSHDRFLEHRRRYTLDRLKASVTAAGLEPVDLRYFFGMLFPAAATLRLAERALRGDAEPKASGLRAAPAWLNSALVAVHDLERAALFPFNRIAGVSAFCLAQKPAALAAKDKVA